MMQKNNINGLFTNQIRLFLFLTLEELSQDFQ